VGDFSNNGISKGAARLRNTRMNLTWSDLNNVQEPGDYPFRDGTITITFSEISIWKRNPRAQFQLMRKHPIQGELRYVLGKEVNLAHAEAELIYESGNGDTWHLTRHTVTGAAAVMHRPNRQSGGQVSYPASITSGASGWMKISEPHRARK
jgi:hypothetical protein